MHTDTMLFLIIATIAALLLLILAFLLVSVVRRVVNERKYRKLDDLRRTYRLLLAEALKADGVAGQEEACRARPGSLAWQAVEDVLFGLLAEGASVGRVRPLFERLGYVAYYEERVAARNILAKASAIDKLGRMQCRSSTPKLIPLLGQKRPEVLSVTVRALSRIGTQEGLAAIVGQMPHLLGGSLVTRKAMETALLNFGEAAIPYLIDYREDRADPWIISCILETLSHLPADARSFALASDHLRSPNPEVRSKALKVLGNAIEPQPANLHELILPLLEDPVWFVRLQAAKSAGALAFGVAARALGKLLFDTNWHVRSEAAMALTNFGCDAIDIFLEALMASDGYAKESICEEIEKSGLSDRLIRNLGGADGPLRAKSRDILQIMQHMHFATPLFEYLAAGEDDRIKQEIRCLLPEVRTP